jgi:hypothetical protein
MTKVEDTQVMVRNGKVMVRSSSRADMSSCRQERHKLSDLVGLDRRIYLADLVI